MERHAGNLLSGLLLSYFPGIQKQNLLSGISFRIFRVGLIPGGSGPLGGQELHSTEQGFWEQVLGSFPEKIRNTQSSLDFRKSKPPNSLRCETRTFLLSQLQPILNQF